MSFEHILLVLCSVISIIALILGSISFHNIREGNFNSSDISGTWEGSVITVNKFGTNTEQSIILKITCDDKGVVTGTKEFSHHHDDNSHSHEQQISGIADFSTGMVYMAENDTVGLVNLELKSERELKFLNRWPAPTFIVTFGELMKK